MTSVMEEWSEETYRLDEIEGTFDFPCVIRVNEGFYSQTDAEGFSQGDILSIDSKMVLQKVAACFTDLGDVNSTNEFKQHYAKLSKEILVPFNYKGKLNVIQSPKAYENVRELAADFPRYATLRQDFNATTEDNEFVTIKTGTVIELKKSLEGSPLNPKKQLDKISIRFQHSNRRLNVELPIDSNGKFKMEQDHNDYTIKEALDRYNLPLHVRFVDNKIKRVYTQNLLEGIENMNIITETLRLNRLVEQTVMVGHYKPLDVNASKDTERFRQRTLVVLPMDNPHISGTEVNVSRAVTPGIYEQAFLVRNVSNSNTENIVDGSLYVDFAMTSQMHLLSQEGDDENPGDIPPPRPPKPANLAPRIGPKHGTKWKERQKALSIDVKGFDVVKDNMSDDEDDEGDYIYPKPRSVSETDVCSGYTLANMNFTLDDTAKTMSLRKKIRKKVVNNFTNLKTSFKSLSISKYRRDSGVFEEKLDQSKQSNEGDSDDEQGLYEDINETAMLDFADQHSPAPSASDNKKYNDTYLRAIKYHEKANKPMALVQPVKGNRKGRRKHFKDLDNQELVDRLRKCGLEEMSELCKKSGLDGSFFSHLPTESLEKDMNLQGIQLAKFIQMRDTNWVPVQTLF